MAALRRPYVAHLLITLACSSATPSSDGSLDGVRAIDVASDCSSGDCPEEVVSGAALAQGAVWITRSLSLSSCSGQCSFVSESASLAVASFGDDGGLSVLATTPTFTSSTSLAWSGVDVTADGATVVFAYADPQAQQMVYQALANGADAGHVTQPTTFGQVIGVASDAPGAIVAIGSSNGQGLDEGDFTGGGNLPDASAALYRVDFGDGGISKPLAVPLDTYVEQHLLAYDAQNVYGVGGGKVWSAPRDLSTMTTLVTSLPSGANDCMNQQCTLAGPAGLAVSGGVVVTSFFSATSACQANEPCSITPTRCQVFNGSTPIFDVSGKTCSGVALDATYAYFAILEDKSISQDCCSDDGGAYVDHYLATTGIARVALAGPATQQPSIIALDTTRIYGPRRLLVDDTYVYGIDPAYVLRFAKTAFP